MVNLRESGARFPCKWSFVLEIYTYFVSKPARSCVAVRDLPKGVLCEIEAIAVR